MSRVFEKKNVMFYSTYNKPSRVYTRIMQIRNIVILHIILYIREIIHLCTCKIDFKRGTVILKTVIQDYFFFLTKHIIQSTE